MLLSNSLLDNLVLLFPCEDYTSPIGNVVNFKEICDVSSLAGKAWAIKFICKFAAKKEH